MRKKEAREKSTADEILQDDRFFFIAGYTSGGAPYGVTWEEMEMEPWEDLKEKWVSCQCNIIHLLKQNLIPVLAETSQNRYHKSLNDPNTKYSKSAIDANNILC